MLDPPHADALPHQPVTWLEVRAAVLQPSPKKAAGPDEISFAALRALWPVLNAALHRLVALCLSIGHMPSVLKDSTLVALRKPGRRDPSRPRSWRLIALQQCLGKVVEHVLARRLTHLASVLQLVPNEQYGAMPGRSAIDAGVALHHDIECAWNQPVQRTLGMLNSDVQGAYDNVDAVRLTLRLIAFRLPPSYVRLVWSFLLRRRGRIRLDGQSGAEFVSSRGLPQGSPLSPILWLLFLAPLWQLFAGQEVRWEEQGTSQEEMAITAEEQAACDETRLVAYVDDLSMRTSSNDHQSIADRLRLAFGVAERWLTANALRVDSDKRELIYFPPPRLRTQARPAIELSPGPSGTLAPTPLNGSIRWLGIWFDPKLSFLHHVATYAARARAAAGCLRMLGNTVRGMAAVDLRRLHTACVQSLLLWAAPVWWWGRSHTDGQRPYAHPSRVGTRRPGHTVQTTGAVRMLTALDVAQNVSLRAVLPVYRTTPVIALQYEAAVPPIEVALDRTVRRFALRLWSLPASHPLLQRLSSLPRHLQPRPLDPTLLPMGHVARSSLVRPTLGAPLELDARPAAASRSYTTILTRHAGRIDKTLGRSHPDVWEPWALPLASHPRVTVCLDPRDAALAAHGALLDDARRAGAVVAYSDASVCSAGKGVGITCQWNSITSVERWWNVTGEVEVYDLEVWGIQAALGAAVEVAGTTRSQHLYIFTDNLSAARSALASPCGSSQSFFLRLQRLVQAWLDADHQHHLVLAWVPGHANIAGNERADSLARAGARGDAGTTHLVWSFRSLASARRWDRYQAEEAWRRMWEDALPDHPHYARFRSSPPHLRPSADLRLTRRTHGLLLAARTGHGDFAPYHERFNHADASLTCRCGSRKTFEHPLTCTTYLHHQHHLHDDNGNFSTQWILDSRSGSAAFARYVQSTDAYNCNHTV